MPRSHHGIEHIGERTLGLDAGEMFALLAPFLERNARLRVFQIFSCYVEGNAGHALALALARCDKSSLRRVQITGVGDISDDAMAALVDALALHRNIRTLAMLFEGPCEYRKWCRSMKRLLWRPGSKLARLTLANNDIGGPGLVALSDGLAGNTTLREIYMEGMNGGRFTAEMWSGLARGLASTTSLEKLSLAYNSLGPEALMILANALPHLPRIKELQLDHIEELNLNNEGDDDDDSDDDGNEYTINSAHWTAFFNIIGRSNHTLERLSLCGNTMRDDAARAMAHALATSTSLQFLDLQGDDYQRWENRLITAPGWGDVANLLERSTSLVEIRLWNGSGTVDDEVLLGFARALAGNGTLRILDFGRDSGVVESTTSRGWDAFERALGCGTDISAIYASNHTLEEIKADGDLPIHLNALLELNKREVKAEIARTKVLIFYFAERDNSIEEFVSMEMNVLPHAIAWMARDDEGFDLLFQFVKGMASLFDTEANKGAKRRRCN